MRRPIFSSHDGGGSHFFFCLAIQIRRLRADHNFVLPLTSAIGFPGRGRGSPSLESLLPSGLSGRWGGMATKKGNSPLHMQETGNVAWGNKKTAPCHIFMTPFQVLEDGYITFHLSSLQTEHMS